MPYVKPGLIESISSLVASLANHSPSPASAEEPMTNGICGLRCAGSFARLGPDGSWLKTFGGYSQLTLDGRSEPFSGTWPRWGTVSDGVCTELEMSVPHTSESECLLWPTPRANKVGGYSSPEFSPTLAQVVGLWPTPTVHGNHNQKGMSENSGDGLATAVKMWPTPRAFMHKDSQMDRGKFNLGEVVQGQLNPAWVECLMNFPPGWTEVGPDGPPVQARNSTHSNPPESPRESQTG